jgi:hypothetical protein
VVVSASVNDPASPVGSVNEPAARSESANEAASANATVERAAMRGVSGSGNGLKSASGHGHRANDHDHRRRWKGCHAQNDRGSHFESGHGSVRASENGLPVSQSVNYINNVKRTYMMMSSHCKHAEQVNTQTEGTNKQKLASIHLRRLQTGRLE